MRRDEMLKTAEKYGLNDMAAYVCEAFSRNIGVIDAAEMDRLSRATAAVAGLGGVGGLHLITLARAGVGRFTLAELDRFEPVNMNRQYGAKIPHLGRPKLEAMKEELLSVNPYATLREFPKGLSEENLDAFLEGADVVLDGLDFFAFDIRRQLFNRAYEKGIPVVTAGPLGFGSALLVFTPRGMSFDEYFDIHDGMPHTKKILHFAIGLAPKALHTRYVDMTAVDFAAGRGPSFATGCQLAAGLAATEAVRLLLGRRGSRPAPYYLHFDPYLRRLKKGRLGKGNRAPLQRLRAWVLENVILPRGQRSGCQPATPPQTAFRDGTLTPEAVNFLLRAGIQAPSGDNVQPWRFRVSGNEIKVLLDAKADTSFFNIRQIASLISCGAVIENMHLAASACGLAPQIDLHPAGEDRALMARLTFSPEMGARENILADQIWRRTTNRKPYKKRRIPDGIWKRLDALAQESAGAKLHWVNTDEKLKRLSKALYMADRIRTERKDLHEYFASMLRFTEHEAQRTRDGFPLKNLEAGAGGEMFLKATKSWRAMRIANALGFGRIVSSVTARGILCSGGAGLVTVPGLDAAGFLNGGRALERVWLGLAHYNLQMQPMTAVTLFRLRWLLEGPGAFDQKHRHLLERVWEEMEALFPKAWNHGLVMLFRAGFGKPIRHGTYRRNPRSFMVRP